MSQNDKFVCAGCGIPMASDYERHRFMEEGGGCSGNGGGDHDWSDDDPLSRAEARMTASTYDLSIVDDSDNEAWQWFEVSLDDHDEVGASEHAAQEAPKEGFAFLGVDETESGETTLRFNRAKDEA